MIEPFFEWTAIECKTESVGLLVRGETVQKCQGRDATPFLLEIFGICPNKMCVS